MADDQSDEGVFDAPVKTEAKAEVKTEAKVEKTAEPAKAEETKAEPTAAEHKSDDTPVPKAALIAERRKRQAAEDELRKLKGETVDPSTDALNSRILLSQDLMRDAKDDFPAMEKVFMELISEDGPDGLRITDPALYAQFRNSANPAKFAYNHAKKHQEFQQKSAPDYEKNLRAQIEQELLAKLGKDASKLSNLTNLAASASNTQLKAEVSPKDDAGVWD